MEREHTAIRRATLDDLVAAAVRAGTPEPVADEARRATARRICGAGSHTAATSRAEAYFWGVVRRRALRGSAPRLTRSLVAASMAADLADAGHAPEVVRREVARVYGQEAADSLRPAFRGSGRAA
jgi:hypothetical protein